MSDGELARRVVDQIERAVRREGLTGPAGGAEARRRFDVACPWPGEFNTERERAYRRMVEAAITRLFSPGAGPVEVEAEGAAALAILPELQRWAEARRIDVRAPEPRRAEADPDGPETLDMFGGAA